MTPTPASAPGPPLSRAPAAWAYGWWAMAGAFAGFGVVAILTIGAVLLAVAGVLSVIGIAWRPLRSTAVLAFIGGLAAAPLYLAWLNRDGPGELCATVGAVTTCSERWSPWPYVAVAVAVVGVAAVAVAATRRTR